MINNHLGMTLEKTTVAPIIRKMDIDHRVYFSEEVLKDPLNFKLQQIKYNDTYRFWGCLTKIDDLKVGDVVYTRWYNGNPYKGIVASLDKDKGIVNYPDYGALRGSIEFSLDDRECWCQSSWIVTDPSINLDSELTNILSEEIKKELADEYSQDLKDEIIDSVDEEAIQLLKIGLACHDHKNIDK